jgi:glutamine synthetase
MAKNSLNGVAKVFKTIKENNVKMIDLKFLDFPGQWQHFSLTPTELTESAFSEGVGFDGSSIRGFQKIHESDMVLIPDPQSAFLDPFTSVPTLNLICNVKDPVTGKLYSRDPRYVAEKAEAYLKKSRLADAA